MPAEATCLFGDRSPRLSGASTLRDLQFADVVLRERQFIRTGILTFALCDVEGSTRLAQCVAAGEFARLIDVHRALLSEAFATHGGQVQLRADEVVGVFDRGQALRRVDLTTGDIVELTPASTSGGGAPELIPAWAADPGCVVNRQP